ncbi:MAG TPA: hypothetical protein VN081_02810 [Dongiaceae bacterium]|nr:hypothetical protein [Dongiaceae bacterium]
MQRDVKQILDKLTALGFGGGWETYLEPLSKSLKEGDNAQAIIKQGDGYRSIKFVLNIDKGADGLSFPYYQGTFIKVPAFEHKIISGIDTEALEALMQRLNWKTDFVKLEERLERIGKGNEALLQSYHKAIANLVMLSATEEGKVVSDALKIRYLLDMPYEQRYVGRDLEAKYAQGRMFFTDTASPFTKDEASNLLEGRSILKSYVDTEGNKQKYWMKATPGIENVEGEPFFFSGAKEFYPSYGLVSVLSTLPMAFGAKEQKLETLKSLQRGGLHEVAIVKNGKEEAYFIEASPETKSIRIYDASMKAVTRREMLLGYKTVQERKRPKRPHL